ncbi:MAG: toll/interleukin-1 receptor domain-containing protein, partial [Verrucomicrobiales bacterium]|nr:toll/interleukin-1 receptor domain-containing protein [Verrucomicrobiales bacterium]
MKVFHGWGAELSERLAFDTSQTRLRYILVPGKGVPQRRFAAFISYRHLDNAQEGRRWASWLHWSLENYRVPESLRARRSSAASPVAARLYPVFRDEEELSTSKPLGQLVNDALDRSDNLIVVCSPRSAESPWVNAEVERFLELGRSDRIFLAIIEGEPNAIPHPANSAPAMECLPRALRERPSSELGVSATSTPSEPLQSLQKLAADFRPQGSTKQGYTSAAAYRAHLEERNASLPTADRLTRRELRRLENLYA